MAKNIKLIITFVFLSSALFMGYFYLYFMQIGKPVVAEWWLKNTIEKKELISEATHGPRVVFISGSNSLFGISGDIIERKTGMKVVNLGLHANLDIDYLVYILRRNIKEGDIVIAPLEYQYYRKDNTPTSWVVTNMPAWGGEYLHTLSIYKQIRLISFTNKDRIIEGLMLKNENKYVSIDKVASAAPSNNYSYKKYLYTSLDQYGSMQMAYYDQGVLVKMERRQDKYEDILSYGKDDLSFTKHAQMGINKLKEITESHGGKFYITWPASIKNKFFNKDDKQAQIFSKNIKDKLQGMNISVLCDPFYANLEFKMFTDTIYHLNRSGSIIRSERLAECLNQSQ